MPSPSSFSTKPRKPSSSAINNHHHNHHSSSSSSSSPLFCRHHSPSATATLDLLILILVLFSGTFLLTSYFSYIFNSLSLLLPPLIDAHSFHFHQFPFVYLIGFLISSVLVVISFEICCCSGFLGLGFGIFRSRKCDNPKCKGLKKAMEFDLQLQTEECLKLGSNDIDKLPWKGVTENNPDYECLRAELRKMAPPNGRAVLLFRAKCGCPIAKLVGWGPKKGRKHKNSVEAGLILALFSYQIHSTCSRRALSNVTANGDHR
ncbi:unnamed protein product [Amaranthus hypochondriacus]